MHPARLVQQLRSENATRGESAAAASSSSSDSSEAGRVRGFLGAMGLPEPIVQSVMSQPGHVSAIAAKLAAGDVAGTQALLQQVLMPQPQQPQPQMPLPGLGGSAAGRQNAAQRAAASALRAKVSPVLRHFKLPPPMIKRMLQDDAFVASLAACVNKGDSAGIKKLMVSSIRRFAAETAASNNKKRAGRQPRPAGRAPVRPGAQHMSDGLDAAMGNLQREQTRTELRANIQRRRQAQEMQQQQEQRMRQPDPRISAAESTRSETAALLSSIRGSLRPGDSNGGGGGQGRGPALPPPGRKAPSPVPAPDNSICFWNALKELTPSTPTRGTAAAAAQGRVVRSLLADAVATVLPDVWTCHDLNGSDATKIAVPSYAVRDVCGDILIMLRGLLRGKAHWGEGITATEMRRWAAALLDLPDELLGLVLRHVRGGAAGDELDPDKVRARVIKGEFRGDNEAEVTRQGLRRYFIGAALEDEDNNTGGGGAADGTNDAVNAGRGSPRASPRRRRGLEQRAASTTSSLAFSAATTVEEDEAARKRKQEEDAAAAAAAAVAKAEEEALRRKDVWGELDGLTRMMFDAAGEKMPDAPTPREPDVPVGEVPGPSPSPSDADDIFAAFDEEEGMGTVAGSTVGGAKKEEEDIFAAYDASASTMSTVSTTKRRSGKPGKGAGPFRVGEEVWYDTPLGFTKVTILAVHNDAAGEAYYSIQCGDRERQTVAPRLRRELPKKRKDGADDAGGSGLGLGAGDDSMSTSFEGGGGGARKSARSSRARAAAPQEGYVSAPEITNLTILRSYYARHVPSRVGNAAAVLNKHSKRIGGVEELFRRIANKYRAPLSTVESTIKRHVDSLGGHVVRLALRQREHPACRQRGAGEDLLRARLTELLIEDAAAGQLEAHLRQVLFPKMMI